MLDRTGSSGLFATTLLVLPLALAGVASSAPARTLFKGPSALQDRPLVPIAKTGIASRVAPRNPDTLEISAFLVEFLKEAPDNGSTTGNGTFGSDSSGRSPLESFRARRDSTRAHYLRVFHGVSEYWRTVSGGKLAVEFRVFPEAAGAKPYALPRTIGQYSPIKGAKETPAHFDSLYVVRIMEMISDAVRKAAADPAGPFAQPKPTSSQRHRAYLLVHAGASRSTDGGDKGAAGANTPADIGDFAVGPSDFRYLGFRNSADKSKWMVRDTVYLKDTLGIALGATGIDSIKNLLVVAETATQDGMNWGIRGTVANLVGRALGIPDLYDVSRGLSVVGQFDLMDAGSLGGRNSLPSMLSAWPRLFMGWATAIEATTSGKTKFDLPAIRPGHDTVLVVRINDGEYLLVENRQRTEPDGKARVTVGNLLGTDSTVYTVHPDSLDSLLRDTTRTRGYVLGSSPDAALPGSGLLVWHVNEWLLKELVRGGAPNAYLGDTLSDRYKGLTLVQASGKQTLGHPFTGITGQTTSDAGSGSDMLPFAWRHDKKMDTITAIGPEGYASTSSLLGGRSLVTLRAAWPQGALPQGGRSSLEADSVWTPGARSISLTLDWGSLRAATDSFPRRTTPSWGDQAILPGPASLPKSVVVVDTTGRLSLFDSTGAHWFAAKDTVKLVSPWDSTPTLVQNRSQLDTTEVAMSRLGATMARPLQTAMQADTLALRDRSGRIWLKWPASNAFQSSNRDSGRFLDTNFLVGASAGPVVVAGRIWLGDSAGRVRTVGPGELGNTLSTGLGRILSICATVRTGQATVAAVDTAGAVFVRDPSNGAPVVLRSNTFAPAKGETFQILSTDFDRDGSADIAVIGSFGNAILWSGASNSVALGWPRRFSRGAGGVGEPGAAALTDLDGDGRPEIVFGGTDRMYAVDAGGIPLPGWPVAIVNNASVGQATSNRVHPAGILGASPLVADLDGNGFPEVVAGTVDGQILAWTGSGKPYGGAALSRTAGSGTAPTYQQTTWPLAAGGQIIDSSRPPYLPIAFVTGKADRLLALSSLSSLDGFRLSGGRSTWPLALGGAGRSSYLPDSLLGAVVARKAGISDFHLFPSPVRKGSATFRYELGSEASSAKLTVYDQTGFQVLDRSGLPATTGRQELALRDLAWGTGVYAARLTVKWAAGGSNEAWVRFGVVR
ncbi:MAG: hypothetical protein RL173_1745 [Fibrobacterota bacterium]|jgi:hypothetical protein